MTRREGGWAVGLAVGTCRRKDRFVPTGAAGSTGGDGCAGGDGATAVLLPPARAREPALLHCHRPPLAAQSLVPPAPAPNSPTPTLSCTPLDPRPALCPLRHSRAVRGRAIAHARGWSRTSGRWCLVVEGERRGGDGDWGVGAGGWWPLSLCRLPWRWRWCGDGCCGRGGGMGRSRSLCCPRSRVADRRRWGWCSGGDGGGARGGGARGDSGGSGDGRGGLRPCRRCGGDDRWWGLRCASECLEGESRARRLPP